jgi:prevent-host-death family protein
MRRAAAHGKRRGLFRSTEWTKFRRAAADDSTMRISVTEAKGQLTDLVRRAEAGEEVVLTRHGAPVARLLPATALPRPADRRARIAALAARAQARALPGPVAARSADFLYDETGMPR